MVNKQIINILCGILWIVFAYFAILAGEGDLHLAFWVVYAVLNVLALLGLAITYLSGFASRSPKSPSDRNTRVYNTIYDFAFSLFLVVMGQFLARFIWFLLSQVLMNRLRKLEASKPLTTDC
jgi:hypothetical protein